MSMFPSQDPMLARSIIEDRHRAADRARLAQEAKRGRAVARTAKPGSPSGAAQWLRRLAQTMVRARFRRNPDAEPSPGR